MKHYSLLFTFFLLTTALSTTWPCFTAQNNNEPQAKRQRREQRNNPRDFFTAQTADDVYQALARGCSLGWKNPQGQNALHNAVIHNNLAVAQALMECDAEDAELITEADRRGFTAIHHAAQLGHLEFIKSACTYYPEIELNYAIGQNEEGLKGCPALYLACEAAQTETVKYLLDVGCNPYIQSVLPLQDKHSDDYQGTALTCVCSYDSEDDDTNGATIDARIAIINMLLDKYPHLINIPENDTETALHITCKNKAHLLTKHLLERGANPNLTNAAQETALLIACEGQVPEAIASLLQHNADPNIYDNSQKTPLHLACAHPDFATIALLLKHGADVHRVNAAHITPTQIAHADQDIQRKASILKLLYMYGAITTMPEHSNDLVATCIRHINTNAAALDLFLQMLTPGQQNTILAQFPTIIEFAGAADAMAFSHKMITLLHKTFPRYATTTNNAAYVHITQIYTGLLFKNRLKTMQQDRIKCNVIFEYLN